MQMLSLPEASHPESDAPGLLAAALSVTRLDTLWAADPRLEDGPGLPARLRGAWGQRLRLHAAEGSDEAAQALELFFPEKTAAPGFGGAPPPYRFAAAQGPAGVSVTLALIGFAGRWRQAAFDALIAALSEPPGLALRDRSGPSARLRLLRADWTRTEGIRPLPPGDRVVLEFATPLRIGPRDALGTRFSDVLVGLAERGRDIGPWIGLRFCPDLSAWRDRAKQLRYDTKGLKPVVWESWSSRNGRDNAAGYLGRLVIAGADEAAMALLAAGTVLHAGRSPGKGCGRYHLTVM